MCEYPGISRKRGQVDLFERARSNNELRDVSRSHSTIFLVGRAALQSIYTIFAKNIWINAEFNYNISWLFPFLY